MKFKKIITKDFRKEMDSIEDIVRPMTLFMQQQEISNLVGVEIGIYEGKNAKHMLDNLDVKKLYLVDPYESFVGLVESYKVDNNTYERARKRLLKYDNIQFIKKPSSKAINDICDDLDFVYIDGNHEYETVLKDIKNYYPKVKDGGIIGGHDCWANEFGVVMAIFDFITELEKKEDREVILYGDLTDWWFIKKTIKTNPTFK